MFIAHIAAGYLLTSVCLAYMRPPAEMQRRLMRIGLAASLLPDIDLIYALVVDHWLVHHHRYVTHWPSFWLAVLAVGGLCLFAARRWTKSGWQRPALVILVLNALLHLALDTIASSMWLLAPFSDRVFELVTVPARYRPWHLNYLLHWTAWLEVSIIVAAILSMMLNLKSKVRIHPPHSAFAGTNLDKNSQQ